MITALLRYLDRLAYYRRELRAARAEAAFWHRVALDSVPWAAAERRAVRILGDTLRAQVARGPDAEPDVARRLIQDALGEGRRGD